jgi:hypothetical protein
MSENAVRIPGRFGLRLAARGRLTDRLQREWTALSLRRRKARYRRGRPAPDTKLAAYLVGCQRSGTDMSLDLLDRCMDVDTFNEDRSAAFHRCRIRDDETIRRLIETSRARCVVFKPICDSHRVSALLSLHGPARAVWIYRDFRGVVNSTVVKWGDANRRHLYHLMAGGGDWGWSQWNREGYPPEALDEVRALVDERLTPHGAAALYWYLRNRCYFDQRLYERDDVAIMRYRRLVTEPLEEFARMCRFLDIEFSEEMASSVHARSLGKGRDVDLSPRISALCAGMLSRLDEAEARSRAVAQCS